MDFLPPLTVARAVKIATDFYGIPDIGEYPKRSSARREVDYLAGKILFIWSDMTARQISVELGYSEWWLAGAMLRQQRRRRLGQLRTPAPRRVGRGFKWITTRTHQ